MYCKAGKYRHRRGNAPFCYLSSSSTIATTKQLRTPQTSMFSSCDDGTNDQAIDLAMLVTVREMAP